MIRFGPRRGRLKVVLQESAAECGLACLATIAGYHGLPWSLAALRATFPVSLRGLSLRDIRDIADEIGLKCQAVRVGPENLQTVATPALLHWGFGHFVVLCAARRDGAVIHDPILGRRRVGQGTLSDKLTGIALEFAPSGQAKRDPPPPEPGAQGRIEELRTLLLTRDMVVGLGMAALLAVAVQAYALAAPAVISKVTTRMLAGGNISLTAVAGLLLLFAALSAGAGALRSAVINQIAMTTGRRLNLRLYDGLLRAPLQFFETRKIGRITAAYDAKQSLEDLVASKAIAALLDALGIVVVLAAILYISRPAFLVSLASTALMLGLLAVVLRKLRADTLEAAEEGVQVHEMFLELLRHIQPIKAMNAGDVLGQEWRHRTRAFFDRRGAVLRANTARALIVELVGGADFALIVALGGWLVLQDRLTPGALLALLFLRTQLAHRLDTISQGGIALGMADVNFHRFIDLLQGSRAPPPTAVLSGPPPEAIDLRGVRFRYGANLPEVLKSVSLDLRHGEFVGVTGASGQGKTSIVKLVLGLYPADGGAILIDGEPATEGAFDRLRSASSTVLQSDRTLVASIAENVAFGRLGEIDEERVWRTLEQVELEADVRAMPMGLNTILGDVGGALSGGQTQRLLLARALYRRPRFLFLDEATSQIDLATEARIFARLRECDLACLCVAHRPETLALTDRVLTIRDGVIPSRLGPKARQTA